MPIYKTNIKKDGLNKYKVRINYTDSFGNRKQLTRTAWGLNAAKEMERALEQQTNQHTVSVAVTLNQVFEQRCNNMRQELRQTTIAKSTTIYNLHIAPFLGDTAVNKIDVRTLTAWKSWVNEKPLNLTTKKNIYGALRTVLNYAVKMEYILANPITKIDNFKDAYYQKEQIKFYTPEEFKKFIAVALDEAVTSGYYDYYAFFMIAYYTGARKGEIHALRWNCIEGNKLQIRRSISQKITGETDVETPPKNLSSIRTVQMPKPLLLALELLKQKQKERISDWSGDNFICGYYRPLRDTSIENENIKYATAAEIKKIRIHDFRHSHASLLINSGINALEVAHRLGHSTVDQTLKTYAHLFPSESDKALAVLDNL